MSDEKKIFEKPLALREKIAIQCLLILLKLVKPTDYSSEYGDEFKKIKELIELV